MKRLVHEPLLHFLVLGAALFGLYAALNSRETGSRQDIIVTSGQIEHLAATFAKTWQRPPTASELKGSIDGYVREEILSREAISLGLDQNDTVIRRRLQQKMEFIAEDFAAGEPTEAELAEYLASHPGDFQEERRFTLRQVFLDAEKRGDRLAADSAAMLADLRQRGVGADTREVGDRSLLPSELTDEPQRGVASQFGEEFAAELVNLKVGEWGGPIRSGYGSHLVFVARRSDGHLPALADVREEVRRELLNARRLDVNQRFLDGLLAQYRVIIEPLVSDSKPESQSTALNR